MAKRNDLKIQAELQKDILKLEEKITEQGKASAYQQKRLNELRKADFTLESQKLDLGKQIEKISNSSLGIANKKLGLEKKLKVLADTAKAGTKEELKQANQLAGIIGDVAQGNKDFSSALDEIATNKFDKLNGAAEEFGQLLKDGGKDLEKSFKTSGKLGKNFDNILESLTGINIEETLSAAGALAIIGSFAKKTLDIKQSLGTSAGESARLAGNMSIAGIQAKLLGGSAEEAEAAVSALVDEFGSLSVVTASTSMELGKLVASSGITGENAAKLLKSLDSISSASIETNINLIKSAESLARAEGVAPAKVLNDIASDTETFAKFGKDGGINLAKAAIQANKLGLNLSTVAGIAENLLDFESSIEKQMEASVILGRQVNLDKARQLSLVGDLEGLQKEVLKQVGTEAEFNAMNVIERKTLADAIGVSVADLGKMVAGEKTSAQVQEEKQKSAEKHMDMQKAFMGFQTAALITQTGLQVGLNRKIIAGAVGRIFGAMASIGPLGLLGAGAAVAGMYALMPKAQTGGVVRETGMAVVHKGESIAGTQFGGRESNNLLKELIKQNSSLMGKLTNKVGEMALSS